MWHPFDLMPASLAGALRDAAVTGPARLSYTERTIARFSDKSLKDAQWPPTVESGPGITIERRDRIYSITHTSAHSFIHQLKGKLKTTPSGQVLSWRFESTFASKADARTIMPPIVNTGSWQDGLLAHEITSATATSARQERAAYLISTYSLLADFPPALPAATHLLGDGLTLQSVLPSTPAEHASSLPAAKGLTLHPLSHTGGFPIEFWLNPAGIVVFATFGPTRALILEDTQALK
jgi:hypothetical protein